MSREREEKTIRAMLAIYCADHHQTHGTLCVDCHSLFEYAQARLGKCPWGEDKPVCANCSIHCYKPATRAQIRQVMRYAGPKMLLRHPVLAVEHLLQQHRPAPPPKSSTCDPSPTRDAGPAQSDPTQDPSPDS
ncbi:MAG: nitrous oxide-stimulated promoter family protein [Pirellulaceae bacterium]